MAAIVGEKMGVLEGAGEGRCTGRCMKRRIAAYGERVARGVLSGYY